MLERPLRWLSLLASLVVVTSWIVFAVTTTSDASRVTVAEVGGAATTSRPAGPGAHEGSIRGALDRVDDALLAPFSALGDLSDDPWASRTLPAAAGLLVYGLGLSYLARYTRGRA